MSVKDNLARLDCVVRESDNPDRQNIDFAITDIEDNVAWVWGDMLDSIEWECNHPDECIEYGDDDERGECLLCGATCDWHYENEVVSEGHGEDGHYTCITDDVPHPHDWHSPRVLSGMLKEYVEEAYGNRN